MRTVPALYLSRDGIEAINQARRQLERRIAAKRAEREQTKVFAEALEQAKRIGFSDEAARELAEIHVGLVL